MGGQDDNPGVGDEDTAIVAAPNYYSAAAAANPYRSHEWYLDGYLTAGTNPYGANVDKISTEYSGKGVHVGLIDEGFDLTNPDLAGQFDLVDSFDPHDVGTVSILPDNSAQVHGTWVAGVVGAAADNDVGTVGVAPGATLVGYFARFGMGGSLRAEMADLLARQVNVDVSNNSWGYSTAFADNFQDPAWASIKNAVELAAETGRHGLGTILVFGAGNDRQYIQNSLTYDGDNTNAHNLTNSRYIITVAATTPDGHVAPFSTPGDSILVAAPGQSIWTTAVDDHDGNPANNITAVNGTSFSAPIVSGIVAMMLEANPNLGYRDVQEILALSARKIDLTSTSWSTNGATNWNGGGNLVSHDLGFGLVDAHAAVKLAETWTAQSTAHNESEISVQGDVGSHGALVDFQPNVYSVNVSGTYANFSIDWVEVDVSLVHSHVGDLKLELVSPTGTHSILMDKPNAGTNSFDSLKFTFSTTHDWGESPVGTWQLIATDKGNGGTGSVVSFALHIYGDDQGADNTYYYTDDFAILSGNRTSITDLSGIDTINAAAVTTDLLLNLNPGAVSAIAGKEVVQSAGTVIENVYGGDGNDTIYGNSVDNHLVGGEGNDFIWGGPGNDILEGGMGNDILDGGTGADRLVGGLGDDVYIVDTTQDVVIENAGEGTDTVIALIDNYVLPDNVEYMYAWSTSGQTVVGNSHDNVLAGNSGNDVINGSGGNDRIYASAGDDTLYGGDGNDILDGGAGNDQMFGGTGHDIYVVDTLGDQVHENFNEGTDIAISCVDGYVLTANVEHGYCALTDGQTLTGNELDNVLAGNAGADHLYGGDGNDAIYAVWGNDVLDGGNGNDVLDGGTGNDFMVGGAGNDTFVLDSLGDIVVENPGEGTDVAIPLVDDYILADNVEWGYCALTAGQTLTGNGLDNVLAGNIGADHLYGGDGNDSIYAVAGNDVIDGGSGNDTLNGGAGDDLMTGGTGDDTFVVDSIGDTVVENANEGTDTVIALVDNYVLATNVENGRCGIAAGQTLTGNELDNALDGAAGGDVLNGAGGNDTVLGGGGNDVLDGGAGADILTGGSGADTFVFHQGEAAGDTVEDFSGMAGGQGDVLHFVGFGTEAEGATFTQIDATHWEIVSADQTAHETITLAGAPVIGHADYMFV